MAKRILVVDDEPDVMAALARAIKIAGLSVEAAASAEAALALCKDYAFDLVVVDFIMPGMTGLELLNRIRGIHPTIRSVVVSGKVDPQLSESEVTTRLKVELEADAYFSKPVSNSKLLEAIQRLLTSNAEQRWEDVAERVLNSEKTVAQIKKAEKNLKVKKPIRRK